MARKSGRQTRARQTRTRQTRKRQTRARQTRSRQTETRRSQKKTRKQGRRMNEFMRRLGKARDSNAQSFNYKGNTYVRRELETGMAVYGKQ